MPSLGVAVRKRTTLLRKCPAERERERERAGGRERVRAGKRVINEKEPLIISILILTLQVKLLAFSNIRETFPIVVY